MLMDILDALWPDALSSVPSVFRLDLVSVALGIANQNTALQVQMLANDNCVTPMQCRRIRDLKLAELSPDDVRQLRLPDYEESSPASMNAIGQVTNSSVFKTLRLSDKARILPLREPKRIVRPTSLSEEPSQSPPLAAQASPSNDAETWGSNVGSPAARGKQAMERVSPRRSTHTPSNTTTASRSVCVESINGMTYLMKYTALLTKQRPWGSTQRQWDLCVCSS